MENYGTSDLERGFGRFSDGLVCLTASPVEPPASTPLPDRSASGQYLKEIFDQDEEGKGEAPLHPCRGRIRRSRIGPDFEWTFGGIPILRDR